MAYIQTRQENVFATASNTAGTVAATTTSRGIPVDNASNVSIQLKAATVTSGTGTFTMQVSNDGGATWTPYSRMNSNATNTNVQGDTRVASVVLNSAGSSMIFVPAGDTFGLFRLICTVATDGSYSAFAFIN